MMKVDDSNQYAIFLKRAILSSSDNSSGVERSKITKKDVQTYLNLFEPNHYVLDDNDLSFILNESPLSLSFFRSLSFADAKQKLAQSITQLVKELDVNDRPKLMFNQSTDVFVYNVTSQSDASSKGGNFPFDLDNLKQSYSSVGYTKDEVFMESLQHFCALVDDVAAVEENKSHLQIQMQLIEELLESGQIQASDLENDHVYTPLLQAMENDFVPACPSVTF